MTLVERLRDLRYRGQLQLCEEAANRIEEYERNWGIIMNRVEELKAALQEIVDDGELMSGFQCKCLAMEALGIDDDALIARSRPSLPSAKP